MTESADWGWDDPGGLLGARLDARRALRRAGRANRWSFMRARPSRSCTSPSSRGTSIIGAPSEPLAQASQRRAVALGQRAVVVQVRTTLRASFAPEQLLELRGHVAPRCAGTGHAHAVDHHAAERHAGVQQALVEEDRLVDRVLRAGRSPAGRWCGCRRAARSPAGALAEALGHVAEAVEELRQVLEQVHAGGALHHPEEHAGAAAEQLQPEQPRPREEAAASASR